MGPVASAVSGVSGVVGGIDGKNQAKASEGTANQMANQISQVDNTLTNNLTNATNSYNTNYQPSLADAASGFQSEGAAADSSIGSLANTLMQAGLDPSVIQQITGINGQGATQADINNLSNTSGTNLAGATGQTNGFYQSEMQNGINPQYAQNAQNQISQQLGVQLADARNNASAGQNMNGLTQALQNGALTSSANLAGNLAGQNQAIMQNGATNLLTNASNLDAQKNSMLGSAASTANAYNQQQMQNLGTSATEGQNILGALQSFVGQGQGQINSAASALGGTLGSSASMYNNANTQAANQNAAAGQSLANGLGGLSSLFPQSNQSTSQSGAGQADMSNSSFGDWGGTTSTQSTAATPLGTSAMVSGTSAAPSASPLGGSVNNMNPALFTPPQQMSGMNYAA